jgi:hypothetical protein
MKGFDFVWFVWILGELGGIMEVNGRQAPQVLFK